jgi:NAD(P)-dependent dehydrogenase (short-subunit alcohol dehydrogenase family)
MGPSIGVFAPISSGVLFLPCRARLNGKALGQQPKECRMKGKTIVATGATSGIGEAAVLELAGLGARIVVVARDEARAQATMRKLEAKAPKLGHRMHLADLSSMAETRKVGAAIAASEPRIDVLINNAGALFSERRVTPEGLEQTFALNHMAYFVLTEALRDNLVASTPSRVVSTSSSAHQGASLDFDDLQSAKGYGGLKVYGRSKLANILFTRELARRLAGTGVTANCLHPGVVATRFGQSSGGFAGLVIPFLRPFFLSPEKGGDTIVYLASSPEVAKTTREYFVKRKITEPSQAARDDAAAKRLWDASETLAGAQSQKERATG